MKYTQMLQLMDKYTNCPDCGNDKVGNGQGELIVDRTFYRSCKCGWSVELDENGREING